jgi:hypothetical protein
MKPTKPALAGAARWLLLVHQLPAHPAYQRVKIWRRLQALGAVAIKKSMYALPLSDDALEDLLWTAKQIEAGGGETLVCEARLVHGRTNEELRALFDAARAADYARLLAAARPLQRRLARRRPAAELARTGAAVRRLRKRFRELTQIDFFGANGREAADSHVRELETRLAAVTAPPAGTAKAAPESTARRLRARTWVTRRGVKIDRVACAWLIRRFIDPNATFRFVDPASYAPARGELRFDMADAEFTHRGDRCSFEVLVLEAGLRDPALSAIGEIVHDLDLKDDKFGRPEAEGVRHILAGLTLAIDDDALRIRQAGTMFDNLYRSLQQRAVRPASRR